MRGAVSLRDLAAGALAGAVGTLALDAVTYLDIAGRGREPSSVPASVAGRIADEAGVDLGDDEHAGNRREAIGALMGYATGVAFGACYGYVRGRRRRLPSVVSGAALGAFVMAATDASATLAGATDPSEWSGADWLADLVPHAAYGIVTALAFDRLSSSSNHRLRSTPPA